jgi:hypothetical protein
MMCAPTTERRWVVKRILEEVILRRHCFKYLLRGSEQRTKLNSKKLKNLVSTNIIVFLGTSSSRRRRNTLIHWYLIYNKEDSEFLIILSNNTDYGQKIIVSIWEIDFHLPIDGKKRVSEEELQKAKDLAT